MLPGRTQGSLSHPVSRFVALLDRTRLPLSRRDNHRLLQAEFEQGFARNFHLLTFGQYLDACACGSSGRRANRRALSAARDGSNDRSGSSYAAHFLGRSGALALALQSVVAADKRVVLAVNHDAR